MISRRGNPRPMEKYPYTQTIFIKKGTPLRSVRSPRDLSVNESDRAEPEPEQID